MLILKLKMCNKLSRKVLSLRNRKKEDSVKSYDHINDCYNQALSITDPDLNNGELSIDFPEEIRQSLSQTKDLDSMPILSVTVEYTIEKPRGGLQFIPGPSAHCYTIGNFKTSALYLINYNF